MSDAVMLAEMYVELLAMEEAGLVIRVMRDNGQEAFELTDLGAACADAIDPDDE